jgi:hypothetical protein
MDEDAFQDAYDSAIGTGLENLQILRLAAGWCENIGVTKGPMGTGMLEAATGLPISGGSLRCEHAKAPTSFSMSLRHGAPAFYEANCVGCAHRKPTQAIEHLGTWADGIIAERRREQRDIEQARDNAERARKKRREERRLQFGVPDPTGQSILDLIDRVDSDAGDSAAESLLVKHAETAPVDFSDALVRHITDEAIAVGNSPLLTAVVAVFERDGRPSVARMLEVAWAGLSAGIAPGTCGSVIAGHAKEFTVDDAAFRAVVSLAAGQPDRFLPFRLDARPAALLRLYGIAQEQTSEALSAMLRSDDVWIRSMAAYASETLLAARPSSAPSLLPSLLDAAVLADKSQYAGDPFAAAQAQRVVGDCLMMAPHAVADEIDRRMERAETKHRRRLWSCYDRAIRRDDDRPYGAAGVVVGRRAAALLLDQELEPELGHEIADTLSLLCDRTRGASGPEIQDLVELLMHSQRRLEQFEAALDQETVPTGSQDELLARMDRMQDRSSLAALVSTLKEALASRAASDVKRFVQSLTEETWASVEHTPVVRAALLDILGDVVRTQTDLELAEPLLVSATRSGENAQRAAAFRAIADFANRDLTLPAWVAESVLTAFRDEYLIIVRAAIRALPGIIVPVGDVVDVINRLLNFAAAYGPERIYSNDVRVALLAVLRFADGKSYEQEAERMVLKVIERLPTSEAAELLSRLPLNQNHDAWPAAAVRALREDADANWVGLRSREREDILRDLAEISPRAFVSVLEELQTVALQRLPYDRAWAWAVSDVFAQQGRSDRATAVCEAVVNQLPDTTEHRSARRFATHVLMGHRLDAAVAAGADTTDQILAEWALLAQEPED